MEHTLLIPGLEDKKPSPDFSRLRDAILRQGRSDRLPFLELFADVEVVNAILGRPWRSIHDEMEFWYRLGYDAALVKVGLHFPIPRSATSDTAQLTRAERQWVKDDDKSPIETREDYNRYEWPDPEIITPDEIDGLAKALPEGMGLLVRSSGILENVMWLMGYTGIAMAIYEDPQLVQDMFDQVGNRFYRAYEKAFENPAVDGICFGEDMGFRTATMIAPDHLRKYHFPHLKRLADLAHKHGKLFILHSCGNLSEVMDDLIDDVGIDAKHSFEDAIMPVSEFKSIYGKRTGVVGGIDIDAISRMETDDLRKYVRKVLEECVPGGGYALGTGNSVTNYLKIENFLAMLQEGWYYRASRE